MPWPCVIAPAAAWFQRARPGHGGVVCLGPAVACGATGVHISSGMVHVKCGIAVRLQYSHVTGSLSAHSCRMCALALAYVGSPFVCVCVVQTVPVALSGGTVLSPQGIQGTDVLHRRTGLKKALQGKRAHFCMLFPVYTVGRLLVHCPHVAWRPSPVCPCLCVGWLIT